MHIEALVEAYNQAAEYHGIKTTDHKGMSRRLVNSCCGFKKGDERISEKQLQALFVVSYKGTRARKHLLAAFFNEISAVFMLDTDFQELAAAIDAVTDKEIKKAAREAKKALEQILKRTLVDKSIKEMELSIHKIKTPASDTERIGLVKEIIGSVEDKATLYQLFSQETEGTEVAS